MRDEAVRGERALQRRRDGDEVAGAEGVRVARGADGVDARMVEARGLTRVAVAGVQEFEGCGVEGGRERGGCGRGGGSHDGLRVCLGKSGWVVWCMFQFMGNWVIREEIYRDSD